MKSKNTRIKSKKIILFKKVTIDSVVSNNQIKKINKSFSKINKKFTSPKRIDRFFSKTLSLSIGLQKEEDDINIIISREDTNEKDIDLIVIRAYAEMILIQSEKIFLKHFNIFMQENKNKSDLNEIIDDFKKYLATIEKKDREIIEELGSIKNLYKYFCNIKSSHFMNEREDEIFKSNFVNYINYRGDKKNKTISSLDDYFYDFVKIIFDKIM